MRSEHTKHTNGRMRKDKLHTSVSRYIHSREIAVNYDSYFAGNELFRFDTTILDKMFGTPGNLLDLGCGTGRHIVHFASKGHTVTGVDLSQEMLAVARRKISDVNLTATLLREDITDLAAVPDNKFDYAICMFSTLGMLRSKAARIAAIAEAKRKLVGGGLFAAHFHNVFFDTLNPTGLKWLVGTYLRGIFLPGFEIGDKVFPGYRGIPGMRLHLFSLREIKTLFRRAVLAIRDVFFVNRPRTDIIQSSRLASFRSNGFIIIGRK